LYSVPSAAAAGNTAAAGNAADSAAVEQIPFIRALLEKSELMGLLLLVGIAFRARFKTGHKATGQRIHFTSFWQGYWCMVAHLGANSELHFKMFELSSDERRYHYLSFVLRNRCAKILVFLVIGQPVLVLGPGKDRGGSAKCGLRWLKGCERHE
jgi:hypothetical protein